VSADSDSGIDKQGVLAAITGTPSKSPSPQVRPVDRPPSAQRPAVVPPPRWIHHRTEFAAVVTAFIGILWLTVGIGRGSWGPAIIGILFGIGALSILAIEVWGAD
jgi:hypothetical protein